jgi:hypothetical protein
MCSTPNRLREFRRRRLVTITSALDHITASRRRSFERWHSLAFFSLCAAPVKVGAANLLCRNLQFKGYTREAATHAELNGLFHAAGLTELGSSFSGRCG